MTLFFSQKSKKTTRAAVPADSSSDKDEEDMIPKEKLARVRKKERQRDSTATVTELGYIHVHACRYTQVCVCNVCTCIAVYNVMYCTVNRENSVLKIIRVVFFRVGKFSSFIVLTKLLHSRCNYRVFNFRFFCV